MSAAPPPDRQRPLPAKLAVALDRTEQALGAITLACILVLVSVQIVQRVTTGGSWAWTGEVAKYAMVWSTFILAAHLLRIDGHLRLDVIEQWLTPRGERIMNRVTDVLIAMTCIGLVWAAWGLLTAPFLGTAPASGIPLTVVYAAPFAGLVLMAVTAVWLAVRGRAVDNGIADGAAPEGVL